VTILLFGRHGQLGRQLAPRLARLGRVRVLGRAEADLASPGQPADLIRDLRPQLVVNAAAYTAVDRAEAEEALARRVNAEAPAAMAAAARDCGALFVHYSTDYVFDGRGTRPYREDDPTAPLNAYGRTKRAGEAAVAAAGGQWLVFRTAWVYARQGRNFLNTMLRLAGERDRLQVVDDQVGSPTSAAAIADATVAVLAAVTARGGLAPGQAGVYHMTCAGETTWCGFARRIFAELELDVEVIPVPTEAYPTPAARPRYSVLDCRRLGETFGVTLPPWEAALAACLAEPDAGALR